MNHDDLSYGAPEGPNTEEAAELANVMPPTLEEAYAEGRKDEREQLSPALKALRDCVALLKAIQVSPHHRRDVLQFAEESLALAYGPDAANTELL